MTSFTLINMHHNAKKAERTNEETLELIGELIKEGFPEKVTINEISDIADRHFNGIRSILFENKSNSNSIKKLFLKKELQDGLKHLFLMKCEEALKMKTESSSLAASQEHPLEKLNTHLQSLSEEECDDFYKIFDQYGKTIKDQDSKGISVFKAIRLFFQEIIAKFKSKNLEDFNDEHTVKVDNATFYVATQTEPKQEVLERKVSELPALETIVEEDENLVNNATKAASKIETYTEIVTPITQIAQEEIVPKATKQLVKPLIPEKSQKVIDAGNKIKGSQKTETPNYVSQFTVNLKPASEKPKIAPKPTAQAYTQAEKQYGQNVASKKQFFESLSGNVDSKSKVKNNVERLVEKFEAKSQEAVAGRSR
ncbi:hypothetical protein [Candidatus Mesenet endosymbiont of Agriotes lineatus]|uniref:hypothetical protein n=1 Tax=Candidatus Mesenet endosymbiont of Agriotes lineatus TaxID=3077948 RepID=UPI0030CB85D5